MVTLQSQLFTHVKIGLSHLGMYIKLRLFENVVLSKIHGPRRDEVAEKRRRLHNEEIHDLFSSPKIIRVIKSRRL